ncbi:MAG: putative Ser/Thr protein kinase [Akkermansiaceae bacterium]
MRQKLGEGGMGVIWEAEDTSSRRMVALKMIRGFAFSSDSEKQRFQTEANAVAQLDHPNIVPIYEVGEIEDQPYFSMKLLPGGTLSGRLQDGAMGARDAAAIMEKLARAIHHAHERGVLHRDLKPDNVLLDKGGEPYLTDFGLAKLLDASSGLTLAHAYLGTPQYMSPEQARGRVSDITAASDVWAAGALLFHMLTGRLPFPGNSSREIFHCVVHAEPAPMHTAATTVGKELESLCQRCLEKDPSRRLGSAEELADELGRWLKGEAIHSRPAPRIGRTLRWARHDLWRKALAALAFLFVAVTATRLFLGPSARENGDGAVVTSAVRGVCIDVVESGDDVEVSVSGLVNAGSLEEREEREEREELEELEEKLQWNCFVSNGHRHSRISVLSVAPQLRYRLPAPSELTDAFDYDRWFVEDPDLYKASEFVVSSDTGLGISISYSDSYVVLPPDYVSGDDLSASSIYRDVSIDDLYLVKGAYTYSWGDGPGQSLTLNIGKKSDKQIGKQPVKTGDSTARSFASANPTYQVGNNWSIGYGTSETDFTEFDHVDYPLSPALPRSRIRHAKEKGLKDWFSATQNTRAETI